MSATTHTPGQWHVHITPRSFVEVRATTPNGLPFVVARVSTRDCLVTSGEELADGHLIAAAPDLLGALQWREQFEPREGEDSNERFERIAETFRRETGYLRPGKDCRMHSHEERQEAWDKWMEAGRTRVRAAIAKATGEQQ